MSNGWQPIETAPKDKLIDILIDSKTRWCDCYHDQICNEWRTSRPSGHLVWVPAKAVTHWMSAPGLPGEADPLLSTLADAREALADLLARWSSYEAGDRNQETAYTQLAKYAYGNWEAARVTLARIDAVLKEAKDA